MNKPTIFIRKAIDGKYFWILCLSENSKNPSAKSPSDYTKLIACRQSALRFCRHLTDKVKLVNCEEIVISDQVGDLRRQKKKKVKNVATETIPGNMQEQCNPVNKEQ